MAKVDYRELLMGDLADKKKLRGGDISDLLGRVVAVCDNLGQRVDNLEEREVELLKLLKEKL